MSLNFRTLLDVFSGAASLNDLFSDNADNNSPELNLNTQFEDSYLGSDISSIRLDPVNRDPIIESRIRGLRVQGTTARDLLRAQAEPAITPPQSQRTISSNGLEVHANRLLGLRSRLNGYSYSLLDEENKEDFFNTIAHAQTILTGFREQEGPGRNGRIQVNVHDLQVFITRFDQANRRVIEIRNFLNRYDAVIQGFEQIEASEQELETIHRDLNAIARAINDEQETDEADQSLTIHSSEILLNNLGQQARQLNDRFARRLANRLAEELNNLDASDDDSVQEFQTRLALLGDYVDACLESRHIEERLAAGGLTRSCVQQFERARQEYSVYLQSVRDNSDPSEIRENSERARMALARARALAPESLIEEAGAALEAIRRPEILGALRRREAAEMPRFTSNRGEVGNSVAQENDSVNFEDTPNPGYHAIPGAMQVVTPPDNAYEPVFQREDLSPLNISDNLWQGHVSTIERLTARSNLNATEQAELTNALEFAQQYRLLAQLDIILQQASRLDLIGRRAGQRSEAIELAHLAHTSLREQLVSGQKLNDADLETLQRQTLPLAQAAIYLRAHNNQVVLRQAGEHRLRLASSFRVLRSQVREGQLDDQGLAALGFVSQVLPDVLSRVGQQSFDAMLGIMTEDLQTLVQAERSITGRLGAALRQEYELLARGFSENRRQAYFRDLQARAQAGEVDQGVLARLMPLQQMSLADAVRLDNCRSAADLLRAVTLIRHINRVGVSEILPESLRTSAGQLEYIQRIQSHPEIQETQEDVVNGERAIHLGVLALSVGITAISGFAAGLIARAVMFRIGAATLARSITVSTALQSRLFTALMTPPFVLINRGANAALGLSPFYNSPGEFLVDCVKTYFVLRAIHVSGAVYGQFARMFFAGARPATAMGRAVHFSGGFLVEGTTFAGLQVAEQIIGLCECVAEGGIFSVENAKNVMEQSLSFLAGLKIANAALAPAARSIAPHILPTRISQRLESNAHRLSEIQLRLRTLEFRTNRGGRIEETEFGRLEREQFALLRDNIRIQEGCFIIPQEQANLARERINIAETSRDLSFDLRRLHRLINERQQSDSPQLLTRSERARYMVLLDRLTELAREEVELLREHRASEQEQAQARQNLEIAEGRIELGERFLERLEEVEADRDIMFDIRRLQNLISARQGYEYRLLTEDEQQTYIGLLELSVRNARTDLNRVRQEGGSRQEIRQARENLTNAERNLATGQEQVVRIREIHDQPRYMDVHLVMLIESVASRNENLQQARRRIAENESDLLAEDVLANERGEFEVLDLRPNEFSARELGQARSFLQELRLTREILTRGLELGHIDEVLYSRMDQRLSEWIQIAESDVNSRGRVYRGQEFRDLAQALRNFYEQQAAARTNALPIAEEPGPPSEEIIHPRRAPVEGRAKARTVFHPDGRVSEDVPNTNEGLEAVTHSQTPNSRSPLVSLNQIPASQQPLYDQVLALQRRIFPGEVEGWFTTAMVPSLGNGTQWSPARHLNPNEPLITPDMIRDLANGQASLLSLGSSNEMLGTLLVRGYGVSPEQITSVDINPRVLEAVSPELRARMHILDVYGEQARDFRSALGLRESPRYVIGQQLVVIDPEFEGYSVEHGQEKLHYLLTNILEVLADDGEIRLSGTVTDDVRIPVLENLDRENPDISILSGLEEGEENFIHIRRLSLIERDNIGLRNLNAIHQSLPAAEPIVEGFPGQVQYFSVPLRASLSGQLDIDPPADGDQFILRLSPASEDNRGILLLSRNAGYGWVAVNGQVPIALRSGADSVRIIAQLGDEIQIDSYFPGTHFYAEELFDYEIQRMLDAIVENGYDLIEDVRFRVYWGASSEYAGELMADIIRDYGGEVVEGRAVGNGWHVFDPSINSLRENIDIEIEASHWSSRVSDGERNEALSDLLGLLGYCVQAVNAGQIESASLPPLIQGMNNLHHALPPDLRVSEYLQLETSVPHIGTKLQALGEHLESHRTVLPHFIDLNELTNLSEILENSLPADLRVIIDIEADLQSQQNPAEELSFINHAAIDFGSNGESELTPIQKLRVIHFLAEQARIRISYITPEGINTTDQALRSIDIHNLAQSIWAQSVTAYRELFQAGELNNQAIEMMADINALYMRGLNYNRFEQREIIELTFGMNTHLSRMAIVGLEAAHGYRRAGLEEQASQVEDHLHDVLVAEGLIEGGSIYDWFRVNVIPNYNELAGEVATLPPLQNEVLPHIPFGNVEIGNHSIPLAEFIPPQLGEILAPNLQIYNNPADPRMSLLIYNNQGELVLLYQATPSVNGDHVSTNAIQGINPDYDTAEAYEQSFLEHLRSVLDARSVSLDQSLTLHSFGDQAQCRAALLDLFSEVGTIILGSEIVDDRAILADEASRTIISVLNELNRSLPQEERINSAALLDENGDLVPAIQDFLQQLECRIDSVAAGFAETNNVGQIYRMTNGIRHLRRLVSTGSSGSGSGSPPANSGGNLPPPISGPGLGGPFASSLSELGEFSVFDPRQEISRVVHDARGGSFVDPAEAPPFFRLGEENNPVAQPVTMDFSDAAPQVRMLAANYETTLNSGRLDQFWINHYLEQARDLLLSGARGSGSLLRVILDQHYPAVSEMPPITENPTTLQASTVVLDIDGVLATIVSANLQIPGIRPFHLEETNNDHILPAYVSEVVQALQQRTNLRIFSSAGDGRNNPFVEQLFGQELVSRTYSRDATYLPMLGLKDLRIPMFAAQWRIPAELAVNILREADRMIDANGDIAVENEARFQEYLDALGLDSLSEFPRDVSQLPVVMVDDQPQGIRQRRNVLASQLPSFESTTDVVDGRVVRIPGQYEELLRQPTPERIQQFLQAQFHIVRILGEAIRAEEIAQRDDRNIIEVLREVHELQNISHDPEIYELGFQAIGVDPNQANYYQDLQDHLFANGLASPANGQYYRPWNEPDPLELVLNRMDRLNQLPPYSDSDLQTQMDLADQVPVFGNNSMRLGERLLRSFNGEEFEARLVIAAPARDGKTSAVNTAQEWLAQEHNINTPWWINMNLSMEPVPWDDIFEGFRSQLLAGLNVSRKNIHYRNIAASENIEQVVEVFDEIQRVHSYNHLAISREPIVLFLDDYSNFARIAGGDQEFISEIGLTNEQVVQVKQIHQALVESENINIIYVCSGQPENVSRYAQYLQRAPGMAELEEFELTNGSEAEMNSWLDRLFADTNYEITPEARSVLYRLTQGQPATMIHLLRHLQVPNAEGERSHVINEEHIMQRAWQVLRAEPENDLYQDQLLQHNINQRVLVDYNLEVVQREMGLEFTSQARQALLDITCNAWGAVELLRSLVVQSAYISTEVGRAELLEYARDAVMLGYVDDGIINTDALNSPEIGDNSDLPPTSTPPAPAAPPVSAPPAPPTPNASSGNHALSGGLGMLGEPFNFLDRVPVQPNAPAWVYDINGGASPDPSQESRLPGLSVSESGPNRSVNTGTALLADISLDLLWMLNEHRSVALVGMPRTGKSEVVNQVLSQLQNDPNNIVIHCCFKGYRPQIMPENMLPELVLMRFRDEVLAQAPELVSVLANSSDYTTIVRELAAYSQQHNQEVYISLDDIDIGLPYFEQMVQAVAGSDNVRSIFTNPTESTQVQQVRELYRELVGEESIGFFNREPTATVDELRSWLAEQYWFKISEQAIETLLVLTRNNAAGISILIERLLRADSEIIAVEREDIIQVAREISNDPEFRHIIDASALARFRSSSIPPDSIPHLPDLAQRQVQRIFELADSLIAEDDPMLHGQVMMALVALNGYLEDPWQPPEDGQQAINHLSGLRQYLGLHSEELAAISGDILVNTIRMLGGLSYDSGTPLPRAVSSTPPPLTYPTPIPFGYEDLCLSEFSPLANMLGFLEARGVEHEFVPGQALAIERDMPLAYIFGLDPGRGLDQARVGGHHQVGVDMLATPVQNSFTQSSMYYGDAASLPPANIIVVANPANHLIEIAASLAEDEVIIIGDRTVRPADYWLEFLRGMDFEIISQNRGTIITETFPQGVSDHLDPTWAIRARRIEDDPGEDTDPGIELPPANPSSIPPPPVSEAQALVESQISAWLDLGRDLHRLISVNGSTYDVRVSNLRSGMGDLVHEVEHLVGDLEVNGRAYELILTERRMLGEQAFTISCWDNNHRIGEISFFNNQDSISVLNIDVHPARRRQGHGLGVAMQFIAYELSGRPENVLLMNIMESNPTFQAIRQAYNQNADPAQFYSHEIAYFRSAILDAQVVRMIPIAQHSNEPLTQEQWRALGRDFNSGQVPFNLLLRLDPNRSMAQTSPIQSVLARLDQAEVPYSYHLGALANAGLPVALVIGPRTPAEPTFLAQNFPGLHVLGLELDPAVTIEGENPIGYDPDLIELTIDDSDLRAYSMLLMDARNLPEGRGFAPLVMAFNPSSSEVIEAAARAVAPGGELLFTIDHMIDRNLAEWRDYLRQRGFSVYTPSSGYRSRIEELVNSTALDDDRFDLVQRSVDHIIYAIRDGENNSASPIQGNAGHVDPVEEANSVAESPVISMISSMLVLPQPFARQICVNNTK